MTRTKKQVSLLRASHQAGSANGTPYQRAAYERSPEQLRRFHKALLRYAKRLRSKQIGSGVAVPGHENSPEDRALRLTLKRVIPVLHRATQRGAIREYTDQELVSQLIRRREGGA